MRRPRPSANDPPLLVRMRSPPGGAGLAGAHGKITMTDRGKWLVVAFAIGLWLAIGVGLAIRAL
jgi:hypothetical protein